MKNALFAAIIAGFVMTSVSFADESKKTETKTTTESSAPAADHMTTADHMDSNKPMHHAKKHKKVTKKTTEEKTTN